MKSCLQILALVFPFGFRFGRNIHVIFVLIQYNIKNHRPIAQWKRHRDILPGKSIQLFCFLNACFVNVLLSKYSLLLKYLVTTGKQSALFSRMRDVSYIGNGLYFVKSHKQTNTEVLLLRVCVYVNVLTLGQKSRYSFFHFILTYVFYSFRIFL